MKYIKSSLSEGETLVKEFPHHWSAYIPTIIATLLGIITLGLLLPVAIYLWLALRNTERAVTNKRLVTKTGILSRNTEEMRLGSIETVELKQSILGRILGYGDILVTGRGVSALLINNADNPTDVKKAIESAS